MRKYTEDEKFMKEAIKQKKQRRLVMCQLAVLLFMMEK